MDKVPPGIIRWYGLVRDKKLICPGCGVGPLVLQKGSGNAWAGWAVCPSCGYRGDVSRMGEYTWTRKFVRPHQVRNWPIKCPLKGHPGEILIIEDTPRVRHLTCIASDQDREPVVADSGRVVHLTWCAWSDRQEYGEKNRGFMNGRPKNPDYQTAGLVLASIALCRGSGCRREILKMSRLSVGQVDGYLNRGYRSGIIERSTKKLPSVPAGSGFAYRLTRRGVDYLSWLFERKVVGVSEGQTAETILVRARENPMGLKFTVIEK